MRQGLPHASWARISAASAAGSLLALAAQGLLALVLLRSFDAAAAGVFSVLAQLAFFWATLALAQSPLSLLAERRLSPLAAAQAAWRASLWRWLGLLPLVLAAWWWSLQERGGESGTAIALWGGLLWLVLLSLSQQGWYLAQSLVLRTRGPAAVGSVRLVPPLLALLAVLAALAWPDARAHSPEVLLGAAVLGFAAGALWLRPALRAPAAAPAAGRQGASSTPVAAIMSGAEPKPKVLDGPDCAPAPVLKPMAPLNDSHDDRPLLLKTLHTLSDVGALTLLAVHWQALHGSAAAGHLLVLLRLAGFVPALVHAAWSQVALARNAHTPVRALTAAVAGWVLLALLGLGLLGADQAGLLGPGWQGLSTLALPVLVWQAGATALACLAHRPLQTGRARAWSWTNIGLNLWLAGWVLLPQLPAAQHLQWLAYSAAAGQALLALYWLWLPRWGVSR